MKTPSSTNVENAWSYNSTTRWSFREWCLIKQWWCLVKYVYKEQAISLYADCKYAECRGQ